MRLERLAYATDETLGVISCRVCGLAWVTTPEQDALLADLFDHDATHSPPPEPGDA